MKQKYFRVPFAQNGDKQSIVENSDPQGYVNYSDGFGPDYEKNLTTDAHAKPPERNTFNELFNCITENIKQYQENGFPEWIHATDNNGNNFPYNKQSIVSYENKLYVSLIDNNKEIPGLDEEKWQPFLFERATEEEAIDGNSRELIITPKTLLAGLNDFQKVLKPYLLPIGSIMAWPCSVAPEGWLECNGDGFDKNLYPELAKILPSGILPDFRGNFPRGWDNHRGIDQNRALLSEQSDAIRNITGQFVGNARGWATNNETNPFYWQGNAAQGNKTSWDGCYVGFDVSKTVPTAEENRPKNIAVMYIIKTDLASDEQGNVPTNIIVSPKVINGIVGQTVPLSTTILPASLASSFPPSYQSSDLAVCKVSDNGFVQLVGAGKATIIVSVSSGLATTIEVSSNVVLSQIQLATLPEMETGEQKNVSFTATPTHYTEPLVFRSSNPNVATIDHQGELLAVGAGSAVISVTGSVSGVTSSRTVTVKETVMVETYLQIENNLSDLRDVTLSRHHLGLKALATKEYLIANDVGAVPLIEDAIEAGTDLNTIVDAGQYYQNITSNATKELNYPQAVAGILIVYKAGVDNGCRQEYMPYNSISVYRRYAFGTPLIFSEWEKC